MLIDNMRIAALLATLAVTASTAHAINSKASLVDVAKQPAVLARHAELAPVLAKLYHCSATSLIPSPIGRMEIPHHYLNGSSGPTNPAEHAATETYIHFESRVTAGMNRYLATGDQAEANCALEQLDAWAKGDALLNYDPTDSSQAWYQSEWTLASVGVAMTVLVNDPKLDPAAVQRVTAWLDKATNKLVSFERPGKDNNNHHYWRGQAAMSVGIVAKDKKLYDFGVTTYKQAVADIDERGAFPKEMARHENAIHYQAFALQPLMIIAQLASRQGDDLFTYSANGRSIRDAVVFLGKAVDDPSLVKPYTSDPQKMGFRNGDLAVMAFYVTRFGTQGLSTAIVKAAAEPSFTSRSGGDMLLFTTK
ncbi:MAG: alginate lyase family protein [Acidobacteriaceae bacterium]|nr:alginate lyase family protein [Acidobacteriaceae bacterium]